MAEDIEGLARAVVRLMENWSRLAAMFRETPDG